MQAIESACERVVLQNSNCPAYGAITCRATLIIVVQGVVASLASVEGVEITVKADQSRGDQGADEAGCHRRRKFGRSLLDEKPGGDVVQHFGVELTNRYLIGPQNIFYFVEGRKRVPLGADRILIGIGRDGISDEPENIVCGLKNLRRVGDQ